MPLEKDFSLVADSTLSTSPLRVDSPAPIKRPARTYGRRKSHSPKPFSPQQSTSSLPILNVHRTAPPGLRDRVPASSEGEESVDDDDNCRHPASSPEKTTYKFGWRKALSEIDKAYEGDEDMTLVNGDALESKQLGFGKPAFLLQQQRSATPTRKISSPSLASAPALVGHIFEESGLLPPSPEIGPRAGTASLKSSPPLKTQKPRRRVSTRVLLHDSDSEREESSTSPVTDTNTSPVNLHHINTPKTRSSQTPPTSDTEVNALAPAKVISKGKRKSRPSVAPLELNQSPSSHPSKARKHEGLKKRTVKAPTKKDREEIVKTRARLVGEKEILIPRANVAIHSKHNFFRKIGLPHGLGPQEPSDPIEPFPSSEPQCMSPYPSVEKPTARTPSPMPYDAYKHPLVLDFNPLLDTTEEDLPDAADIIAEMKEQDERTKRQQELMNQKLRILAAQRKQPMVRPDDDDDDDLEILPAKNTSALQKLEGEHSKAVLNKISHTRKIQMNLAGVNRLHHVLGDLSAQEKKTTVLSSRDLLNANMLSKLKEDQLAVIDNKRQRWVEIGGKVQEMDDPTSGAEFSLKNYVDRGLQLSSRKNGDVDDEGQEDEEGSDPDWEPELRGSRSPEPGTEAEEDITMVNEIVNDDDDNPLEKGEEENLKVHHARRRQVVIESDEEENDENAPPSRPNTRRPAVLDDISFDMEVDSDVDHSTPSTDDRMDDGTDKENNTKLMFDRSEDKENRAVVRFEPSSLSLSSSNLLGLQRVPSLSSEAADKRRPFQDLIEAESPRASDLGPSNLTQIFEAQLSSTRRTPDIGIKLAPFINAVDDDEELGGFSQFPDDEFDGKLALQPSFSDLFEFGTEKQKSSTWPVERNLDEPFAEKPISNKLRNLARSDTLALTQDVLLQPAFEPKEDVLRKADLIFEKEQEYVLEVAFNQPQTEAELYVNEYGFLTQTRPDVQSPEVYRPPSPTQMKTQLSTRLLSPMSTRPTQRSPLRTLSMSDPSRFESSDERPFRRLRKRSESPSDRAAQFNLGTKRRNAFDVLREGAKLGPEKYKRQKLEKNEFIEAEAEESDDENRFGFLPRQKDANEDEDDEDLDKTLETLVDDQEMDEEMVAEDLVREKFKEHEALDDKDIEERAQAVTRGEKRLRKHQHGVLVDDSDEDDEDDENRRRRRQMRNFRKTREDVQALEANPETKAFAESYKATLNDDEDEFAYLAQDGTDFILASLAAPEDEYDEYDVEEGDEEEREFLTSAELHRRIRERGEQTTDLQEEDGPDLNDTAWVDMDENEEDDIRVKTIKPTVRKPSRPRNMRLDPFDVDDILDDGHQHAISITDERQRKQELSWGKREGRNRNLNTARSVGGAAVTGHAKTKPGSVKLLKSSSKQSSEAAPPKILKSASSVLTIVDSGRLSRFS